MTTTTADVVVAGAGHNSLITAAYLAVAGRHQSAHRAGDPVERMRIRTVNELFWVAVNVVVVEDGGEARARGIHRPGEEMRCPVVRHQ